MRWIASLANCFPSLAISCLLEKRYQKPMPTSPSTMMRITMTCPDDFEREFIFNFFIVNLVAEPEALDYFTISDQNSMFLFARITAEAIPGIDGEIDQITVGGSAFLAKTAGLRFAIPSMRALSGSINCLLS